MALNTVAISGNVTRDPELRDAGGTPLLRFGVAVNNRKRDAKGIWVDDPCFVECELWGSRADAVEKYLKKGMKVSIQGSLRYHAWEAKDGSKRSQLTVNVREIELPARVDAQQAAKPAESGYDVPF